MRVKTTRWPAHTKIGTLEQQARDQDKRLEDADSAKLDERIRAVEARQDGAEGKMEAMQRQLDRVEASSQEVRDRTITLSHQVKSLEDGQGEIIFLLRSSMASD